MIIYYYSIMTVYSVTLELQGNPVQTVILIQSVILMSQYTHTTSAVGRLDSLCVNVTKMH